MAIFTCWGYYQILNIGVSLTHFLHHWLIKTAKNGIRMRSVYCWHWFILARLRVNVVVLCLDGMLPCLTPVCNYHHSYVLHYDPLLG